MRTESSQSSSTSSMPSSAAWGWISELKSSQSGGVDEESSQPSPSASAASAGPVTSRIPVDTKSRAGGG